MNKLKTDYPFDLKLQILYFLPIIIPFMHTKRLVVILMFT